MFILETDASNTGFGATLFQINEKSEKKIITHSSMKLKSNEENWGITEKELGAVVYGIEKFKSYLRGIEFHIQCANKLSQ